LIFSILDVVRPVMSNRAWLCNAATVGGKRMFYLRKRCASLVWTLLLAVPLFCSAQTSALNAAEQAAAAAHAAMMAGSTSAPTGTVHYYYTDPQGTVLAKTDAQGNIIATYDYAPYGSQAMGTPPNGPGYTGHVNDPDTGLVYMQARYYDPGTGRFLSVDPVAPTPGNIYSFNRYAYASNNPIMNIDPDGRQSVGEMINSGAEGCGPVSCAGWAALDAVWTMAGAEGVSQIADKGWANTSSADRASAGLEIAAVLPPVKIASEAAGVLKTAVEVADAAKGVAKGKNIVAPGGREAAKSLFREADVAGKGGRTITKDATGGGRAVVGRTADGKSIRIRFKPDGTTRIQAADKKIIFPKEAQ